MARDTGMLRAAAMIGLLANPQSRARYDHSATAHATKDPNHRHIGGAHPTFAEWIADEATVHAEAFPDEESGTPEQHTDEEPES